MEKAASNTPQPFVVAVAGPAGAGKSTLVRAVAKLLGDATTVFFDDYGATSTYPADFKAWVHAGADPNAWQTPEFANALAVLRSGAMVVHLDGMTRLDSTPFVVVEEPFGRARPEVAPLIDMAVLVDLPLEIALARKLRQYITWARQEQPAHEIVDGCEEFLARYLDSGRDVNAVVTAQVRASCDLVVDGLLDTHVLAATIAQAVRSHLVREH